MMAEIIDGRISGPQSRSANPEPRRDPMIRATLGRYGSDPVSVPEHAAEGARLVGRRNPDGQQSVSVDGMHRVSACSSR
jgi:hypothetical protein